MAQRLRGSSSSLENVSGDQRRRMESSLDTLDSLLREVKRDWRQTTGPDANPLDIALPLLDNTSVGLAHRYGEFVGLKDRIGQGLRVAVIEHFQTFNDSIGSYRNVVHSVANSKGAIRKIEERLRAVGQKDEQEAEAHGSMASLNENFKTYNEMIEILSVIERVKKVPTELDGAMSDKNYAKAQQLLQDVDDAANSHKLWSLPALSNLKEYFEAQQDQLFEILVEETISIIYSKRQFTSYNTVNDLLSANKSSNDDYSSIEEFLVNSIDMDIAEAATVNHDNVETFIQTLTVDSLDNEDSTNVIKEFSALHESNPFAQIQSIMSIIDKLDKLSQFVDIVVQRFGLELNQMINRVAEDTKLRHPKLVKLLNAMDESYKNTEGSYRAIVIQDLFWNLFTKLLFFLQTIRIMAEVHQKLLRNRGVEFNEYNSDHDASAYNGSVLYKFWGILHKEIQTLLMTYISNEDHSAAIGQKLTKSSSLKSSTKKPLFQFYQVEYDDFHTTQLKHVLQDLFPGFINSSDMLKIDSPYIEDNKFLKQSKVIPADVMNMRYILEPFLLFIQGTSLLLAQKFQEEPIQFFNHFMENDFLPLLEDNFVSEYFEQVESVDTLELWEPILNVHNYGATDKHEEILEIFVQFKRFFNEVCLVLNTSLQFRIEFMPILFKLLSKFGDKVEGMYKELFNDLLSFLEPHKALSNAFSTHSTVKPAMLETLNKVEFKNSFIISQLEAFQNSLLLILEWLEHYLPKQVDLKQTDINLSQIEKLRKSWFFFQVKNVSTTHQDPLDIKHTNKLILDSELKPKYDEIVGEYQTVKKQVDAVLRVYQDVLDCN